MPTQVNNAGAYTAGQCTAYVASVLSWIPSGLGDAKDWIVNAPRYGLQVSSVPVPGSVAVWGADQGGARTAGHVAIVTGVQPNGNPVVSEMNWTKGPFVADNRTVTTDSARGIQGYILPPGANPGYPIATAANTPVNSTLASEDTGGIDLNPIDIFGGIFGKAIGTAASKILGPIFTFVTKSGEVVIGFGILTLGFYILITHTKSGGQVVQTVKKTAGTVAKVAA